MADTRKKNINWNVGKEATWEGAQLAVLMDIRDELQRLNGLLGCANFREIPRVLRTIRGNTSRLPVKEKNGHQTQSR